MQIANKISIIIPVLNEAVYIGKLLAYLSKNSSKENIAEVIVVDGGSTDGSLEIIECSEKTILIESKKGRAVQLNIGAKKAKGDILYFLHADSFPPKDFDKKIIEHVGENNVGCFRLKFEHPSHYLLCISQWFTRFNFSLFRGGDQSLFIRKNDFELLNGYDERYIVYEDVDLINRIYKNYSFIVLKEYVVTSERKFIQNGVWKLHFKFLMIHIKYWLGQRPERLYEYYYENIQV